MPTMCFPRIAPWQGTVALSRHRKWRPAWLEELALAVVTLIIVGSTVRGVEASTGICGALGTYGVQIQYTMTYPGTSAIPSATITNWWQYSVSVAITNVGTRNVTGWALKVGFQNKEWVTKVAGATPTPMYPGYGSAITFSAPEWASYIPDSTFNPDPNSYNLYITISGTRIGSMDELGPYPSSLTFTANGLNCSSGHASGASYYSCCKEVALTTLSPSETTAAPISGVCNGVLADYIYDGETTFASGGQMATAFNSRLVLSNTGTVAVTKWSGYFDFQNGENLTSVANAATNPSKLPASGNDVSVASPAWQTGLPTSISVGGNSQNYEITVTMVGTRSVAASGVNVLPASMTLFFNGHLCTARQQAMMQYTDIRLRTCCPILPVNAPTTAPTSNSSSNATDPFENVQTGPCTGIYIDYIVSSVSMIPPVGIPQPFRLEASMTIMNIGTKALKNWGITVAFRNNEIISSLTGAQVDTGTLPEAGSSIVFTAPYDSPNIPTSVMAAGEITQYQHTINIVGTEFGVSSEADALPLTMAVTDPWYKCRTGFEEYPAGTSNRIRICCDEVTATPTPTPTAVNTPLDLLGDITIQWDVTSSFKASYWAMVTITNRQPYRGIESYPKGDGWLLEWNWAMGEFIWSIKGAEATSVGDCLNAAAYKTYGDSLSSAHSCLSRPSIVDLPPSAIYSAGVANCCKNGSLTALALDPLHTDSSFIMQVGKIAGNMDATSIYIPTNFSLGLDGYVCSNAVVTTPSVFQLDARRTASSVLTFVVTCKPDPSYVQVPKCCVSFSAYYNDTFSPCSSCACGCNDTVSTDEMCSADIVRGPELVSDMPFLGAGSTLALEDDPLALLDPISNLSLGYSRPCADHCPVNVHWHIKEDFLGGWSAQLMIINREKDPVKDWYAVISHPGFKNVTSIYSTEFKPYRGGNDMIFYGFPSYNDWILGVDSKGTLGSVQTVVVFAKNTTFNMTNAEGWPLRVLFNGYECDMPLFVPTGAAVHSTQGFSAALSVGCLALAVVALLSPSLGL